MVNFRTTKANKELIIFEQEESLIKRRFDMKITKYFLNERFTDEDREMIAEMRKYDYKQGFLSSEQFVTNK